MSDKNLTWPQANCDYLRRQLAPIVRQLMSLIPKTDLKPSAASATNETESSKADIESNTASAVAIEEPQLTEVGEASDAAEPTIDPQDANDPPDFTPALEILCERFHLTTFERYLLLMAIGYELDVEFGLLCAKVQNDPHAVYPTLSLMIRLCGEEADMQALAPNGKLRRWQLIDMSVTGSLLLSPFKVKESVFHYLTGTLELEPQLDGVLEPAATHAYQVPSHLNGLEQLRQTWLAQQKQVINLYNADLINVRNLLTLFAMQSGHELYQVNMAAIPQMGAGLAAFSRLLFRETLLKSHWYYIVWQPPTGSPYQADYEQRLLCLAKSLGRFCFIGSTERLQLDVDTLVHIEVPKPTAEERLALWRTWLPEADTALLGHITERYDLNFAQMRAVERALTVSSSDGQSPSAPTSTLIKSLCREQSRKQLSGLVQMVEPKAVWEDLIISANQQQTLRNIALQAAQRYKVYHEWGFAEKSSRGLGISALFYGSSGTGKTFAAEVLAHTLQADLYHIDLSAVVSKYIGETEKNLKKVFELAEGSGAILLFDEADSLFGKRSEVRDSHDRHANIEVSYLLQRMEAYSGLSILTTNIRSALDSAFLRRIRFIVSFQFPDETQRAQIWQRVFPASVPREDIDVNKLARIGLSGASIRNIALTAAFIAADANEPVNMGIMLQALKQECQKIEKSLNPNDIKDWV